MKTETRRSFLLKAARFSLAAAAAPAVFALASCGGKKLITPAKDKPLPPAAGYEPGYLKLHRTGALKKRGQSLYAAMESCGLCPRACGVNRLKGEKGYCNSDARLVVSSFHPQIADGPLARGAGSGSIFLSNCNLRCVFCISHEVSISGRGSGTSVEQLSEMMLSLQNRGCCNINLVTPTHYAAHAVLALDMAASRGLRLPVVWTTAGWESPEVLQLLDGVVDIYLTDFKFSGGDVAFKYADAPQSYPEETSAAIIEMNRQVGKAVPAADGIIYRGLMLRHLVLPGNAKDSIGVMRIIAETMPKDIYLTLMSGYMPAYRAKEFAELSRRVTPDEFDMVVRAARKAGLTNIIAKDF